MNRIKELRGKRRMSQAKLAELAGVSRQAISYIECGRTKNMTASTLVGIASALDVPVDDLFLPKVTNEIRQ